MEIRKLQGSERYDAFLIASYCFHSRMDDPEKEREKQENETFDHWGAFDADGTMMAEIINNPYRFMIDGTEVKAGGIGAVATLPEYRETGAIRALLGHILRDAYKNGEIVSALYPFNHAFYRKLGYDTVTCCNGYELMPAQLKGFRSDASVTRWQGGPVTPYMKIHNAFMRRFNLSVLRDEKLMEEHMKTDKLWQDRKFTYLFSLNGQHVAYLTFTDVRNDPGAILRVDDCAWTCPEGFGAIFAFLGRFSADYAKVQLVLPYGIDLLRIIRAGNEYDIGKVTRNGYMVRAVNAKALLEIMAKPANCDLTVRITDDVIPENNTTLRVMADGVRETADTPDVETDIRTLGQLAVGCISPDEAMLKPDLRVLSREDMFRKAFREKPVFIAEHF